MSGKKSPSWKIRTLSSMSVGDTLGSGTYGVVFMATDGDTPVALKKIKMEPEQAKSGFPVSAIREIKILKALKHENIVLLREVVVFNEDKDRENFKSVSDFSHGDVFMVFEYADYDLYGLLKSSGVMLQEAHIKSYMKQLLEGVHFLHKNMILHRDIKSANILITRGNVLKIADWGMARFYQKTNARMSNPVVTRWYRSPELLCGARKYGPEVDMWSVGCIFGEMKTRTPIFAVHGDSDVAMMDLLWNECGTNATPEVMKKYEAYPLWDKFKFSKTSTKRITQKFVGEPKWDTLSLNFLGQLLEWDPDARISASDALSHDYFHTERGVVPTERLPRFDNVECARQSDVTIKNTADHEKKVEAHRRAERAKRDAAATAASSAVALGSKKRAPPPVVAQAQSKYKIIKRDPNAKKEEVTTSESSAAVARGGAQMKNGGGSGSSGAMSTQAAVAAAALASWGDNAESPPEDGIVPMCVRIQATATATASTGLPNTQNLAVQSIRK